MRRILTWRRASVGVGALLCATGLAGCGDDGGGQDKVETSPPSARITGSPYLSTPGYLALRDIRRMGKKSVEHSKVSSLSDALSKHRARCLRVGNDASSAQVQALREQCALSIDEVRAIRALGQCGRDLDRATGRKCTGGGLVRLEAILGKKLKLANQLVFAVTAGPCRNLLLVDYVAQARLVNATDKFARAVQSDSGGIHRLSRGWWKTATATFETFLKNTRWVQHRYPVCRPR